MYVSLICFIQKFIAANTSISTRLLAISYIYLLAIPIWVAYINYIAKGDLSEDEDDAMDRDDEGDDRDGGDIGYTIEEKREVLLRAVSATQWHVPQVARFFSLPSFRNYGVYWE